MRDTFMDEINGAVASAGYHLRLVQIAAPDGRLVREPTFPAED